MEILNDKIKEIKLKLLDVIEQKISSDMSVLEIIQLAKGINKLKDDKEWYSSIMDALNNSPNLGFSKTTLTDNFEE